MADLSETIGSDLPSMSAEDEAAFAAEEAAAKEARTAAKGGGHQRIAPENEDGEGEPPAATPAKPAAAAPSAQPPAKAPAQPAAAQPAPAPAAAANPDEDEPDAVTDTAGNRYVPVATMVGARKGFQGQIKDLQTALAKANEQNELLTRIAQGKVQPAAAPVAPPPPPEPEKNPFDETTHPLEHSNWERLQLAKRLDAIEASNKASAEAQSRNSAMATAQRAYQSSHAAFVAQNPQYADAYGFVMKTLVAANKAIGMSDAEAIQAAENTEWNVVQRAVASDKMPSAMLWDLARASGWVAPAPGAAAPAGGAAPAAATAPSPAKQIELAQQGAAAAISLSDASGGSAPQPLTLATVAAMSKEEFAAISDEQFRKLAMGSTGRRPAAA